MLILLFFAFIAGVVTIFAPCIWPILPIILSGTTTGGRKKPLGITAGIMVSFGFFTLALSYLERILPISPNGLRYFAVAVIFLLGLTLLVPRFSRILEASVSRLTGRFGYSGDNLKNGFWSGFLAGAAIGLVWSPCAGPIFATIATLAATQKVTLDVILVTVFYILGLGVPLFLFATLGKYFFTRSRLLSRYTGRVQQVFGVIMILAAFAIATNYDTYLAAKLSEKFPSFSRFATVFENRNDVATQLYSLKGGGAKNTSNDNSLFNVDYAAPDFTGISNWLNTDKPLTMADLKGKVVLVDFWTYTCINCLRTLPHVTSWYDKYHDQGFVVVGVHTPEFQFEKETKNVADAIKRYNIHYPVAQDNNYKTWNAYSNQFWPAEYLIDANGHVRRTHFGEGKYDEMEKAIQVLLRDAGQNVTESLSNMPDQTPTTALSPETYLGNSRMRYFYPDGHLAPQTKNFSLPSQLPQNRFALKSNWTINSDNATSGISAQLEYNFHAAKVFLVMRPPTSGNGKVKVLLDGKPLQNETGTDVKNGEVTVNSDRLYTLINLGNTPENHILQLDFETPGTQAFAFTFG